MLSRYRRDLLFLLATCVLALAWTGLHLYRLTHGFTLPPGYARDSLWYGMLFRTMIEHGGYTQTERLGAPFGFSLLDFPYFYWTQLGLSRLLAWLTPDPTRIFSRFVLLTSGITAATAFAAFRCFGLRAGYALVAGVLYTNLPFHLLRMPLHPFLSAYYGVPLGLLAAYAVNAGRHRVPLWAAVAAAAVCGGSGIYYAALAGVALLFSGLFDGGWTRPARPRWAVVFAVLCLSLCANLLPNAVYWMGHGTNPAAVTRSASESDFFALRPIQLFLPQPDHILRAWGVLEQPPVGTIIDSPALGWVAGFGLLAALVHLLAPRRFHLAGNASRWLARMGLWLFLCTVPGGLGTFFADTVGPYLRALDRWGVALGFVGLFVSLALLQRRLISRGAAGAALSLLLAFAVLDQTPSSVERNLEVVLRPLAFAYDQAFVGELERTLPEHGGVLVLPYLEFPEGGMRFNEGFYGPLRLYYHSRHLRFSYGAMKGRPAAAWAEALSELPAEEMIFAAENAGFAAIVLLNKAYSPDRPSPEKELGRLLGAPFAVSENRDFAAYRLKPAASPTPTLDLPPGLGNGWHAWERANGHRWAWAKGDAALKLFHFEAVPRERVLRFDLQSPTRRLVRILFEGQETLRLELEPGSLREVRTTLRLPPGTSLVQLATDAPSEGAGEQAFAIRDPVLGDTSPANP